jgi:hypothetical protein
MPSNLVLRLRNQLRSSWKFCLSVRKSDWDLSDYPIAIHDKQGDRNYDPTRVKRYIAYVLNWGGLLGMGDSEADALRELKTNFAAVKADRAKSRKLLPRPGTRVPIEFAPREKISAHSELVEDFVHRVLELDWAWISDESSLWDFHQGKTNAALIIKIKEVYGVDVSDVQSARVSEILDRIAMNR